jgi:Zn-dependent protease with chaperone function
MVRRFLAHWGWLVVALTILPAVLFQFSRHPITDRPPNDPATISASAWVLDRAGLAAVPIVVRPGALCGWGTVSGLGGGARIVLSEGTLRYPPDQVSWVVGHEATHVRLGDPLLGVIVGWLWIAMGLAAGQTTTRLAMGRFGARGLLLAPVAVAAVWVAGLPVFNLIQRQVEWRADRGGVELAGSGAAAANFVRTSGACLGVDPSPGTFDRIFRLNHPALSERVRALEAMR